MAVAGEEVLHFHFSSIRCMNSGGEAYTLPPCHIEKNRQANLSSPNFVNYIKST